MSCEFNFITGLQKVLDATPTSTARECNDFYEPFLTLFINASYVAAEFRRFNYSPYALDCDSLSDSEGSLR